MRDGAGTPNSKPGDAQSAWIRMRELFLLLKLHVAGARLNRQRSRAGAHRARPHRLRTSRIPRLEVRVKVPGLRSDAESEVAGARSGDLHVPGDRVGGE